MIIITETKRRGPKLFFTPCTFQADMILSDKDLTSGKHASIEPFKDRNVTPNGYDLTISEIYVGEGENVKQGTARIPPKTWFAISTEEYVKLNKNICGSLWIRTTWARQGIISSFGMVDAGFHGNLTLSAYNASSKTVEMPVGERFAQIVLHTLHTSAEETYEKRSGRYQGQRGVTLNK